MSSFVNSRKLRAATAAAALLSVFAAPARAQDASAPTKVGVAQRVIDSASAYQTYVSAASALKGDFSDAASVRAALIAGAAYQPEQLQEGEVAYVALLAMQDAAFVNSVRGYMAFPGAADKLAEELSGRPQAILDLPGAEAAAVRLQAQLRKDGEALRKAGEAVKQSAYDIQRVDWSKAMVGDGPTRLQGIKAVSQSRVVAGPEQTARLIHAVTSRAPAEASDQTGRLTATAARGLAVAALAVMGKAGEENSVQLAALMAQRGDGGCLKLAKLNLYQCLASAGPQYEDVFCLGEHALKDTAACVLAAAGDLPGEVRTGGPPSRSNVPAPVLIPVAAAAPAPTPLAPQPQITLAVANSPSPAVAPLH